MTTRVVIDARIGAATKMYVEMYADSGTIEVQTPEDLKTVIKVMVPNETPSSTSGG